MVISREYSLEWNQNQNQNQEPYYLVNVQKNKILYVQYKTFVDKEKAVLFGRHLGDYRYYDMDIIIKKL